MYRRIYLRAGVPLGERHMPADWGWVDGYHLPLRLWRCANCGNTTDPIMLTSAETRKRSRRAGVKFKVTGIRSLSGASLLCATCAGSLATTPEAYEAAHQVAVDLDDLSQQGYDPEDGDELGPG